MFARILLANKKKVASSLESGGTGDDLDELSGDDGLPGPVVGERQLLNHLACKRRRENRLKNYQREKATPLRIKSTVMQVTHEMEGV